MTQPIWRLDCGFTEPFSTPHGLRCCAISPDGRTVAAGHAHGGLHVVGAAGAPLVRRAAGARQICAVSWAGTRVATGCSDGTIALWDTERWEAERFAVPVRARRARPLLDEPLPLALSPDGSQLAFAAGNALVFVRGADGGFLALEGHTGDVTTVAWSPDGTRLASGDRAGFVRIWEAATGETWTRLEADVPIAALAWSPDSRAVVVCSGWEVWLVPMTGEVPALGDRPHGAGSACWSPDGRWVATGSNDHKVRCFAASGGSPARVLGEHGEAVNGVCWGQVLCSAGDDGLLMGWETPK